MAPNDRHYCGLLPRMCEIKNVEPLTVLSDNAATVQIEVGTIRISINILGGTKKYFSLPSIVGDIQPYLNTSIYLIGVSRVTHVSLSKLNFLSGVQIIPFELTHKINT